MLRETVFRAWTDSDAGLDIATGSGFGIDARCDVETAEEFRRLNLGSGISTGVEGIAVGVLVTAIAGEPILAPGLNTLDVSGPASGVMSVPMSGLRGNARTASRVTHRTVKRVVEFSRGSNFKKSHIAAARSVPSQIPLRRVVIAKLICIISALLARSLQSSF
jgi:hypothetical protein